MPTFLLALPARSPDRLAERLRQGQPPVIARVQADHLVLDPRSVLPEQDVQLLEAVRTASADLNPESIHVLMPTFVQFKCRLEVIGIL